jgi:hypothetical protein
MAAGAGLGKPGPGIHAHLRNLTERSIAGLERLDIWPPETTFYREPVPGRGERGKWANGKRKALASADIIFLDPDNGLGDETPKHTTFDELRMLRRPGRAIVVITFPGRSKPHVDLLSDLHTRLRAEVGSQSLATLRTNVSVPAKAGRSYVQRQRWFTVIDPDLVLLERLQEFARNLAKIPRLKATLDRA